MSRGRVRLVLVHGSRLSHTQWLPQVSRIEADADSAGWLEVVTPDLPGHGARAVEPFTLDRAVGAVAAAVEGAGGAGWSAGRAREPGFGLNGPEAGFVPVDRSAAAAHEGAEPAATVILAGHSLGGYVALAYAATYPRRLSGLVLLGCGAVPRGPGATAYRGVAVLTEWLGPARMTRVNDQVLHRLYPPDLIDDVVAGGYWFGPTRAAWSEVMSRCGPHQLTELTCPVLVAGGVYDQLIVDARRYARSAARGRVARIAGAGHFAGFDRPQAVTDLLTGFVREVSAG